ncbi:MAG TPA: hypothetical protein VFP84_13505 [Kofleriaceae bacterium]|nr:hypothetical protein [Kofleriaceae bacterium]
MLGISPNGIGAGGGGLAGALVGFFVGGPIGAVVGGVGGAIGGHAGMKAYVRSQLEAGLSVFKTDPNLRHNVGAKLVHDYLNAHGAKVVSRNGRFHYTTKGDADDGRRDQEHRGGRGARFAQLHPGADERLRFRSRPAAERRRCVGLHPECRRHGADCAR